MKSCERELLVRRKRLDEGVSHRPRSLQSVPRALLSEFVPATAPNGIRESIPVVAAGVAVAPVGRTRTVQVRGDLMTAEASVPGESLPIG
jgi:hypothetical protein